MAIVEKTKYISKIMFFNFFDHNVGKNAAAIAYYLIFALFPFLIFVSNLLGVLNLDIGSITRLLTSVLPRDIVEIIVNYLEYVDKVSTNSLFVFSLFFSVYFPMRVARGLMENVRLAYKLKKVRYNFSYVMKQIGYTFILFLSIALTLLFLIMGHRFFEYITKLPFFISRVNVSDFLITLWDYLRFLIVGLIMFGAVKALYIMSQDKGRVRTKILPGTIAALIIWLLVSVLFSMYVDNFANYSVVYGTLGAVIVLLIWLYLTALILILGAELNGALEIIKGKNNENM